MPAATPHNEIHTQVLPCPLQLLYYGRQTRPRESVQGPEEGIALLFRKERLQRMASRAVRWVGVAEWGGAECSSRWAPAACACAAGLAGPVAAATLLAVACLESSCGGQVVDSSSFPPPPSWSSFFSCRPPLLQSITFKTGAGLTPRQWEGEELCCPSSHPLLVCRFGDLVAPGLAGGFWQRMRDLGEGAIWALLHDKQVLWAAGCCWRAALV